MDNYKVYELIIGMEQDDSALTALSLVEKPAVKYEVMKFDEDVVETQLHFSEDEERVIIGVALLADTPIFRKPNKVIKEPHYVVFSKDTIKSIVIDYFKAKLSDSFTVDHKYFIEGVTLYQSILLDESKGIYAPKYFKDIKDGSWIVALKVDDEAVWNKFQSGELKGISMEGTFTYTEPVEQPDETEQLLAEIYKLIK